jgi:serine/threonine protein phosphatase PrpC
VLVGDVEEATTRVIAALEAANAEIYQAAWEAGGAIGSTVAVLLIRSGRSAILWAGDSRVYRCRNRALLSLTTDHSQVEQMVASGLLDRSEADNHPMAHVLSRAVGVRETLALDRVDGEVEVGDIFLLCSDGLSRMIGSSEIQRQLLDKPPRAVAARLVDMVLDRGAPDNVTVAVVGCDATTLLESDETRPA